MEQFFKSNKPNVILVLASFLSFLLFALIGIEGDLYGRYSYHGYLGYIFVPIIGGLFLILLPLTILNYFGKLHFVKIHKFMSAVDFLGVFGVTLAQSILMLVYGLHGGAGVVFTYIFVILTMVFSFPAAIICFYQLVSLLKVPNPKKVKAMRNAQSSEAAQKLRALKKLFDDGVITEDEYNEKKQKYIDLL